MSNGWNPNQPQYAGTGVVVADATPMDRAAFLNKVYLTMSAGVAGAMGLGFYVANDFIRSGAGSGNHWLNTIVQHPMVLFLVYLVAGTAAQAVSRVRGVNVAAFAGFVGITGALVLAPMFALAVLQTHSFDIVWNAFGMSALLFGGLTMYVMLSGKDFSTMGGFLTVATLLLLGFSVATLFFHAAAFQMAVVCAGLAIFSLWVLYDTSVVMRTMSADMWMSAALALFVDFIMIMIRILYIMLGSRR